VGVRWTEVECCTRWGQEHLEEPIVEFSCAIISQKTLHVVSSGINLSLVRLLGGDAGLLFLIRIEIYSGPSGVVVNEEDIVQMATFGR